MQLLKILVGNDGKENLSAKKGTSDHMENKPFLKGLFPFLLEKTAKKLPPEEGAEKQESSLQKVLPSFPLLAALESPVPTKEAPKSAPETDGELKLTAAGELLIDVPPQGQLTAVPQITLPTSGGSAVKQPQPEQAGSKQPIEAAGEAIRMPANIQPADALKAAAAPESMSKQPLAELVSSLPVPKDFSKLLKKEATVTKVDLTEVAKESNQEKESSPALWQANSQKDLARSEQTAAPITLKKLDQELTAQIEQLQKWQVKQSHAYLSLTPAALGKVDVLIKKTPEQLLMHIEYEKQEVKPKLEQLMHDMQQRMKERGVEVLLSLTEKQLPKQEAAQSSQFDKREADQGKKEGQREEQKQKREQQTKHPQEDYEEAT